MRDDGSSGDAVSNDGIFTAMLPGKPANKLLAFHIQATDAASPTAASSWFPAEATAKKCYVRFGDPTATGSFGTYRLWMTQATKDQWMRVLAFERIVGNRDAYGNTVGHNVYPYLPAPGSRWVLLPYDLELSLGAVSDCPNDGLFTGNGGVPIHDPRVIAMLNTPVFRRAYWRAFKEAVTGPMLAANYQPVANAYYNALYANGIVWDTAAAPSLVAAPSVSDGISCDPRSLNGYIDARRNYIGTQLNTVVAVFEITTNNGQNYTTTASSVLLAGTAPVEVQKIRLNGNVNTVVSWPGPIPNVTTWNITVNLNPGQPNMLTVTGYDRFGNLMTGVSDTITITQTP